MNEQIKELAKQADGVFIHKLITGAKQYTFLEKDLEKFAELIVRECADVGALGQGPTDSELIKRGVLEHFGVEE